MNKTKKKVLGEALIVTILEVIGSILVTAETEDMTTDEEPFGCFGFGRMMDKPLFFFHSLSILWLVWLVSFLTTMSYYLYSVHHSFPTINLYT